MLPSMSKKLVPGDMAPDFSAIAVGGPYREETNITLSDFSGKTVVLYFYPKDDTPGCTAQACALRNRYEEFSDEKTVLFGVSIDPPESHRDFIAKYRLPFPLISDASREIVQAYGVWVEKNLYGQKAMGTERSTFVIKPDGTIKSIFRKVKPDEHADTVFEDLRHFEP